MILKVLIWQVSNDVHFKNNALKILEQQHGGIEIIGEVSNEDIVKVKKDRQYDILLVVGAKATGMNKVTQDAAQLNLPEEKILGDWIVCIPGFTLEKYRHLQRSRLSIISKNCFGGFISHLMGLPFRSPFVNLFMRDNDCVQLFENLPSYLSKELVFARLNFESRLKFNYPIVTLGDVELHMNHYSNFEEALAKWNERKQKINWYNLFVVGFTSTEDILKRFDELPYGKKVCFVPFKSDLDSAWYIDPNILNKEIAFSDIVNGVANNVVTCYDLFDMLLYGKKTLLIDM